MRPSLVRFRRVVQHNRRQLDSMTSIGRTVLIVAAVPRADAGRAPVYLLDEGADIKLRRNTALKRRML
jgi:hypothetical protein